jgi:ribosome maturation factor RimP
MDDPRTESIKAFVEPLLAEQRTELVELLCRPQGGGILLRLLVDKVGGVTIQECARLNQLLGQALDASGLMAQDSYVLEVSSPGLDRPLVSKRDYERAVGEELKLVLHTDEGRVRDTQGILLAVQPEAVVLKTTAGNVTLPMVQIRSAKKVIRL